MSRASRLLPQHSRRRERLYRLMFPVDAALARNFGDPADGGDARVQRSLEANYFTDFPDGYLDSAAGRADLADHLHTRREVARRRIVPWLDSLVRLAGARVLEIGCGTGSSTVALAEQGADVVGLELVASHLQVARDRLEAHRLRARLVCANVLDVPRLFADERFDVVLFYGSLEHMLLEERLAALRDTWARVRAGGVLGIVDAPNRLWYFDRHTAQLPFFQWLPDDLAYLYSARSPRPVFNRAFGDPARARMVDFMRWGRGVSYHELELALGKPVAELDVLPSMLEHDHARRRLLWAAWTGSRDGRYQRFLMRCHPGLPAAFCEPSLNLALRR